MALEAAGVAIEDESAQEQMDAEWNQRLKELTEHLGGPPTRKEQSEIAERLNREGATEVPNLVELDGERLLNRREGWRDNPDAVQEYMAEVLAEGKEDGGGQEQEGDE